MVFGDFTLEEILLLLEVNCFGKPWERVLGVAAGEWLKVAHCVDTRDIMKMQWADDLDVGRRTGLGWSSLFT